MNPQGRSVGRRGAFFRCVGGGVVAFALLATATVPPALAQSNGGSATLVFPPPDSALQAGLNRIMREVPFNNLVARKRLSVALVDLSDPAAVRYAAVDDNHMRYAASLPKIAIMLAVFDRVDKGVIEYTPALRRKLELAIRNSDNRASTELLEMVGFEAVASTLRDPRYELYSEGRRGGLWVGKDYGAGRLGYWRRDPMHNISHGATARQVARFLVMLEQGDLVSEWASAEMKDIMGSPRIKHKFVLGMQNFTDAGAKIFRKSGTWRDFHSDAALIERNGKTYVAVALMESNVKLVLARLIVRLDNLIQNPSGPARRTGGTR